MTMVDNLSGGSHALLLKTLAFLIVLPLAYFSYRGYKVRRMF